jgi:membrane-associated phospholipid phosphatase
MNLCAVLLTIFLHLEILLFFGCMKLKLNFSEFFPRSFFRNFLQKTDLLLIFHFSFYSIFFYYSFFVAFILWLKSPKNFQQYFKKFLILSFIGLAFFFFIPTAPPWMVNEIESIGIERIIYGNTILRQFSVFSLYQYFIYGNAIAAFPSLHTAWPAFTSLFLIKIMKNKVSYLFLIIPLMIGFSVVLTGEHYIVDVVAGFILAYLVNLFPLSNGHLRNQTSAK